MINVAAIRMQQFGVQFYQASLTASDIDKLVRFEVLNPLFAAAAGRILVHVQHYGSALGVRECRKQHARDRSTRKCSQHRRAPVAP